MTSHTDDPRLDNPIHAALSGAQVRFALRSGSALRYEHDVAPFLALPSPPTSADWVDAVELVPFGGIGAVLYDGSPLPEQLQVAQTFELVQMVADRAVGAHDPRAVTLSAEDVPEMTELVRLTEPGPFLARTIELGRYIGIRRDGALAAMAGERMRFDGWTEISAVCTAPSSRGEGLATSLISTLVADIHARAENVFLHVLSSNVNAIALYERLGFRVRAASTLAVLARAGTD